MGELIGKWNYYFLRYGAGTVVGAIMAVWLAKDFGFYTFDEVSKNVVISFLSFDFKIHSSAESLDLVLLSAVGFAFCYIASAPGTVFHAARGLFWKDPEDKYQCCRCVWKISLFVVCLIPFAVLVDSHFKQVSIAAAFAFGVIISQFFLLIVVFCESKHIRKFYKNLASARSLKAGDEKNPNLDCEYVESYRDLREHGNAFEIILLEFLLLAALLFMGKDCCLFILALWVAPASFCWVVGTILEFGMIDNYLND